MIMLGSKKARLAKRKAEDPPDLENFRRPVVARRGHFNEDAFGTSPLERATVRASDALLWAMAFESAIVRAEERAAGAREMGERGAEVDRLIEAREYAPRAAQADARVERTCKDLAREFRRVDVRREPFDPRQVPARLDLALPDRTLVILFRAGFRIEDLRIPLRRRRAAPADPIAFIADGLEVAARATGDFGRELAEVAEYAYQPGEE